MLLLKHVCVQLPASAAGVTLPAVAAAAPLLLSAGMQQTVDISCPPGAQQLTCSSGVRRVNDGTDRQTDGRTVDRSVDPSARTMRALPMTVTLWRRRYSEYIG